MVRRVAPYWTNDSRNKTIRENVNAHTVKHLVTLKFTLEHRTTHATYGADRYDWQPTLFNNNPDSCPPNMDPATPILFDTSNENPTNSWNWELYGALHPGAKYDTNMQWFHQRMKSLGTFKCLHLSFWPMTPTTLPLMLWRISEQNWWLMLGR